MGDALATRATALGQEREAPITRQVLLRAARQRFSLHGYADVTLRDIAGEVGVSAALVVKYFGNKEALFAEAVSFEQEADLLLDAPLAALGEHLVRALLELHEAAGSDPMLRAVFTANRPGGARFRENFERQVVARLADRLPGVDPRLRAELVCAQLIGLGASRLALRSPRLSEQSPEALVARYRPILQSLLDEA
ncbi:MAG: TetR family transcriptional regulator [Pseudonocardiaceae bacterium]|nr:TetR family transcriptional regulator [Pseudonocardiaceae bacterium]